MIILAVILFIIGIDLLIISFVGNTNALLSGFGAFVMMFGLAMYVDTRIENYLEDHSNIQIENPR